MNNKEKKEKDFAAIIVEGIDIKTQNYDPDKERSLLTELFRESGDQEIEISRILGTIEVLKAAQIEATDDRTDLIGEFYQIAVDLAAGDDKDQITRDLTFFYLTAGLNEEFIFWCDILLNTIQKDNIEYRATLFAIGAAQIFVNQWDKAKDSFNLLLKEYPEAAEAYFGLALTYLKLGDQNHFQSALDLTRRLSPELGKIIDRLSSKSGFSINDYILEMSLLDEQNEG